MEDDAIVKAAPRQSLDPLDVVGRKIGTQLDTHAPTVGKVQVKHIFRFNRNARRRTPHGSRLFCSFLRHHGRSEEHTSELQSLMRISYAVFCLKKKKTKNSKNRK